MTDDQRPVPAEGEDPTRGGAAAPRTGEALARPLAGLEDALREAEQRAALTAARDADAEAETASTATIQPLDVSLERTVIEEMVPHALEHGTARPTKPLLEVRGLRTSFHTRHGVVKAVTGIDFEVGRGEVVGLVGESGCGKSVTSMSIMRLIAPPGRIEDGQVLFDGRDLLTVPDAEMRRLRGDRIAMIFQQPTSALNPVMDVGAQLSEVLEIHRNMSRKAGRARALELLRMVGIPDPERRLKAYPHEMSGGMAQRVMIAMALACEPEVLIADEPTTALDVTIQAQILDLMRTLQRETGTAIVLITHDLGVVAEMCDRVAVMYAGEIVEHTDVVSLFRSPKHPYTRGLIDSIPVLGEMKDELAVIPGSVPNLIDLPAGCRFAPRCGEREQHGRADQHPELLTVAPDHEVRCWLYDEAARRERPAVAAAGVAGGAAATTGAGAGRAVTR